MDAGKLVPDETVVDVMAKAVTAGSGGGLLLDGFPRTVPQAEALDRQLAKAGKPLDAVVVITARADEIVGRITGRRSCAQCGKAYHVKFLPPRTESVCDACGSKLTQRDDDKESVVRQRLEAYNRQTEPVIAYYRGRPNIQSVEIDGSRKPDEVTASLVEALNALRKPV
jgi:adenylate kinase